MSDRLNPGESLAVDGSIASQDGQSTLILQGDGNLVLYRASGRARWATNTYDRAVSQAIMQVDGNFVMYGPGGEYIWDTATHGHPGAWLLVQDDGNVVIYDQAGSPLWATDTPKTARRVAGFLPSTSGLHFPNWFPNIPLLTIDVLGQQIAIGDAANGLCGGMVFTVRDYFEAGIPMPLDRTAPTSGPLFDYLVKRLFDSFNLILPPPPLPTMPPLPPFGPGPATYMWLMNSALPDHETVASGLGLAPHGRAWIMIHDEWPKVKADIDSDRLSPLGLIQVKSVDPLQMGDNHQVLAYGYTLDGTDLTIHIYDPNGANDDAVTLSLNLADPQHTTPVTHSAGHPVWCFFRPVYTFSAPPFFAQPVGVGDHFYTTSAAERDNAITNLGYISETVACYVFDSQSPGTTPLYRLVNQNNGDHFYTTSAAERDNAVTNVGYSYEGVACSVFDSQPPGTVPLYRLVNQNNGDHFYTTSAAERDNAVTNVGYSYEGVACSVFDSQSPGTTPLYRLLKVA